MSNGREGGIWALAGYLYQIVGTVGITARVSDVAPRPNITDDIIVNLYDVGGFFIQAQHEAGEDALLRFRSLKLNENDDCVLLQFKYSMTDRPIGGPELKEIIKSLDESVKKVSRDGQNVTACVLITNRRFTSGRKDRAEEVWKVKETEARAYQLRRVLDYSIERFISELQGFGREYGAFREEIEQGIKDLIGGVILDTGRFPHCASVDKKDLIKAFTGYREARRLTVESLKEPCRRQLDRVRDYIRIDQWDDSPVPRGVFEDIVRATSERALVGLCGPGGCGKSFIMWYLLNQKLDRGDGCCMVEFARNIQSSWIEDTVHEWRYIPDGNRPPDNLEKGVARLLLANSKSQKPILWLGLDGLDEGITRSEQQGHIQSILREFRNRDLKLGRGDHPPATLVVTCRNEQYLKQLLDIPYDYPREDLETIRIDDFSRPELETGMRQVFPELSVGGIYARYDKHPELLRGRSLLPSELTPLSLSDSIDASVWASLHHPAMWRALLGLMDRDTQLDAIKGDPDAVRKLASNFVKWFHDKLRLRRQQLGLSDRDELLMILGAIAQHSSGEPPFSEADDWVCPACEARQITESVARELHEEAKLAGLVELDANYSWQWRHTIVRDYLISNAQAG